MTAHPEFFHVNRWNRLSLSCIAALVALQLLLIFAPWLVSASVVDHLTTLYIYIVLALMWNVLAGYGGLISVGQQAFFGLGAYAAIRLTHAGVPVYASLLVGALLVALLSFPVASLMLRLKGGEFAIGMWVVAELIHLAVNLDPLIQGETGTSLIALNAFESDQRRALTYWASLGLAAILGWIVFWVLRGKLGSAAQAIRDSEDAAASVGVHVQSTKTQLFVFSAFGCACAGALWVATTTSFQPKTYFSVQWSAYMIFMVLVGGIGTFEGPVLGAILFFLVESFFGGTGVWYLIGLGAIALSFALYVPRGIWGAVERRFELQLLPIGYLLQSKSRDC